MSGTANWSRIFFWEEDVIRILGIPIKHGMDDLLAWYFDKKGLFSVKSAYHVLHDCYTREPKQQSGENSSGPSHESMRGFRWKDIWQLKCPPKVRHFFWRFTHNSLPLRKNISRRGMEIDTRCPVCWRLDEDGEEHCFLKCKYVKECCARELWTWKMSGSAYVNRPQLGIWGVVWIQRLTLRPCHIKENLDILKY